MQRALRNVWNRNIGEHLGLTDSIGASDNRDLLYHTEPLEGHAMIGHYRNAALWTLLLVCSVASVGDGQTPHATGYHLVGQVTTDSGEFGFLTLDRQSRQLYGVGNGVIDIDRNQVVSHITLPEHGVVIAPELGRGLGMDGALFELSSHRVLDSLHTDGYTSAYDALSHRAFLFRRSTVVVDVRRGRVVDTINIGGDPAGAVADGRGRVFVNLIDADSLIVIDARGPRIVARWPLTPCTRPLGLAIDRQHDRLFVACEHMLAVVNASNGRIVAQVDSVRGGREIAFDSTTGLIFNASGFGQSATLSVIRESSPDHYAITEVVRTGPDGGVRAVVDESTHRVYLTSAHLTDLNSVYIYAPQ